MTLQQLRFLTEIVRQDLNISAAARTLHTSQPGISKQIRHLEEELGVELFTRSGKHLSGLTAAGDAIVNQARDVVNSAAGVRAVASEYTAARQGNLTLATTHTQCRYVLPPIIERFMGRFPDVALHMHQGSPMQISQLAVDGTVDFAIATEALELFRDLVMMPCYRWNRAVLVPKDHSLSKETQLTIEKLADFPLVTYTFGFTGRSRLDEAFRASGLRPRVVLTAADADVIKTYVRLGLGVGIVANMAFDADQDSDLVAIDAGHLFAPSTTRIGFRRGMYLRGYMYDFIEMFAPHLTPELVQAAVQSPSHEALQAVFDDVQVPEYGA